jgi:hypothetical protein
MSRCKPCSRLGQLLPVIMLLCYDFLEKEEGDTDGLHYYSVLQPLASNWQNMLMLAAVLPLLLKLH